MISIKFGINANFKKSFFPTFSTSKEILRDSKKLFLSRSYLLFDFSQGTKFKVYHIHWYPHWFFRSFFLGYFLQPYPLTSLGWCLHRHLHKISILYWIRLHREMLIGIDRSFNSSRVELRIIWKEEISSALRGVWYL